MFLFIIAYWKLVGATSNLFAMYPDVTIISTTNLTNNVSNYRNVQTCNCDLTSYLCDFFCCCDESCSSSDVTKWSNNDLCKPECTIPIIQNTKENTPIQIEFPDCAAMLTDPQDPKLHFNQIDHIGCLYFQNIPYYGQFKNEIIDTTNNGDEGNLLLSFYALPYSNALATVLVLPKLYNPGAPLYYLDGGEAFYPSKDVFGLCQQYKSFAFLVSEPINSCVVRFASTVAQPCPDSKSRFSIDYYNLQFKQFPSATTGVTPLISESIPITVTTSAAGTQCSGLVRSVAYQFEGSGTNLSNVSIEVTYQSVTLTPGTNILIPLEVSAGWSRVSDEGEQTIPVSGTPGYLPGYPILVGYQVSSTANKPFILRNRDYQMYGPDVNGQCLTPSQLASQPQSRGYDFIFGQSQEIQCQIPLTYAQYQSTCSGASDSLTSTYQLFLNFANQERTYLSTTSSAPIYFGKWGGSDFHRILDWIQIRPNDTMFTQALKVTPTAQLAPSTCVPIASQLLTIFYSKAGVVGNLQNYIIQMQLANIPNTLWQWNSANQIGTQEFQMSLKIQFKELNQEQLSPGETTDRNLLDAYVNVQPSLKNKKIECLFSLQIQWVDYVVHDHILYLMRMYLMMVMSLWMVQAGVPSHFDAEQVFTETILSVLHKYDLDENLRFDRGEYADVLRDIYLEQLRDLRYEVDSFTVDHLEDCLDGFLTHQERDDASYDDLVDDLHVYFTEYLMHDAERCPDIRHIWEKYFPHAHEKEESTTHNDL